MGAACARARAAAARLANLNTRAGDALRTELRERAGGAAGFPGDGVWGVRFALTWERR